MRNRTAPILPALALFVVATLATSGAAHGYPFCVTNASDLQAALDAASDNGAHAGETNFIVLLPGTYLTGAATGNGPFHYQSTAAGTLRIEGGSTDCAALSTPNAALTVLDGHHATRVLELESGNGNVSVEHLTIQNGEATGTIAAGLTVNLTASLVSGGNVEITGNIFRNNHSATFEGGLYAHARGTAHYLSVSGNLFVDNSADSGESAGSIYATSGTNIQIYNNTVTQNTTSQSGGVGGLYVNGADGTYIANNIVWNNTNVGLYLASSGAALSHNDYGKLGGMAPGTDIGNLSITPQFVDAANNNFHLAGDSPLLAISPFLLSVVDVQGHPSPTGGRMDLGAYFETIFIDGFNVEN